MKICKGKFHIKQILFHIKTESQKIVKLKNIELC